MCGVAGLISKQGMNVASELLAMMNNIQHRGPDASGISVYGYSDGTILRVLSKKETGIDILKDIVSEKCKILKQSYSKINDNTAFCELSIDINENMIKELHNEINMVDCLAVHSLGDGFRVYKDGGLLNNLTTHHQIKEENCTTHGIGHVRMATESAEDINAAHPFVSPFYPELSIVHNGQFTNYFKLRRFLESRGAIFKTLNDSEAASHLIAYAMSQNGGDLEAALRFAGSEMDGIFCIIAATKNQLGFVKDKLGIKPLLVAETEDTIMIGSEQIEFTVSGEDIFAEEMAPGEVKVWNL